MDAPGGKLDLRRSRPLPEFMAVVARRQSTGILAAFSEGAQREILFVDGEVRAARSDVEEEKLGSWLVLRGHINEDEKALTLLSQGSGDTPPLGHLLVTRGCIDQETLEHELAELAVTIIRRAAAASRAFCEFVEGRTEGQPDTLPDLTTTELILLAAREFRNVEELRSALEPLEQIAWPSVTLDTLLDELSLTPTEAFFLSRLDGTRRLEELIRVAPVPDEEALATLYALKTAGIITVGDAPAAGLAPLPSINTQRGGSGEHIGVVDEAMLSPEQLAERARILELADEVARLDHYAALNLPRKAKADEVQAAWERIQEQYSPDRSLQPHVRDLRPQLQTILDRASEAHEVLANPVSRKRYNRILESLEAQRQKELEEIKQQHQVSQEARNQLVEANFKRADELIHEGEPYLAIQLLEQACRMDPRPAELLKLARLLLRNPLWKDRALKTLRRALEVDPNFVDAWLELAEFWRRRNNPERQRKALERALAADPEHPRASQMYRQLVGQRELERLLRRARSRQR